MNDIETKNVFEHFEQFIKLSDKLKFELTKRLKPVEFKKGQMVLDANRISK